MQIHVVLPSGESRSVELGGNGLVVGSATGCDIVLEGPAVSPRHAFFQIDPVGAPTVQEMGTSSAVFVNGARITGTVALKSSDQVSVAGASFTLTAPSDVPTVPPPTPAPVVAVPPVATTPAAPPPPPRPAPSPQGQDSPFKNPLILGLIAAAVLLAIGLIVVAVNMGGDNEAASAVTAATPTEAPSEEPQPTVSPSEVFTGATPPVTKARVNGFYSGKYDFNFKANCSTGPCGGLAQSGSQFRIPYSGSGSYRGHSKLRSTCKDGGVHVQAPYDVDLLFHPTDASMVGDEWTATKVDINLTISRKPVVKKVRTSPTVVTTLTCHAYKKNVHFIGVSAG